MSQGSQRDMKTSCHSGLAGICPCLRCRLRTSRSDRARRYFRGNPQRHIEKTQIFYGKIRCTLQHTSQCSATFSISSAGLADNQKIKPYIVQFTLVRPGDLAFWQCLPLPGNAGTMPFVCMALSILALRCLPKSLST